MSKVIFAIFTLFIVILAFSGVACALWGQKLNVKEQIHTGRKDVRIVCYKCLRCCCCPLKNKVSCSLLNKHRILVTWKNATDHCKVWVIVKMKNTGTLPVDILRPTVTINRPELERYLRIKVLFFGPFNRNPHIPSNPPDCWHCCCRRPPIQLDPGQYLFMCVRLRFSLCTPDEYLEDPINITITLNYQLWNYDANG